MLRSFSLINVGVELGQGLTPFSVICQGHPQSKEVLDLAQSQQAVESGTNSITAAGAATFRVKDARFPRTLIQVSDKLRAFKIVAAVILGETNPYVTHLAAGLDILIPYLLQGESPFTPKVALSQR